MTSSVCYACEAVAIERKRFAESPESLFGRKFHVIKVDEEGDPGD